MTATGARVAPAFGPGTAQPQAKRHRKSNSAGASGSARLPEKAVIVISDDEEETAAKKMKAATTSIDLTGDAEAVPITEGWSEKDRGLSLGRRSGAVAPSGLGSAGSGGGTVGGRSSGERGTKEGGERGGGSEGMGREGSVILASGGDTPPLTSEVCPICGWDQGGSKAEVDAHIDRCIRREVVYIC